MALTATVTPGKTFVGSELVTNSKLNQLAAPTVDISGTADTVEITDDAVTAAKLAFGATYYCAASTSSNVITLTASGHTLADATLAAGLLVVFKADATNTSTVDIKLSSAGTDKNLYKDASQELAAGDIRSGQMCVCEYDGTQWQLISNLGNGAWDRYVETGGADGLAYTATFAPTVTALTSGTRVAVKWNITNAGAVTFAPDGLTAKAVRKGADAALVAGDIVDNQISELVYDATANSAAGAWLLTGPVTASTRTTVPVRQTVLSCSVASTGLPNYVSRSGQNLTFQYCDATPLVIAFAAGHDSSGAVDYVASVSTNTSNVWTISTTNATYYLYAERNTSTGTITYGSVASLRPDYTNSSTISTTLDQHTFNLATMKMSVGIAGPTSSLVQRVFLGECVVSGGVLADPTLYMPRGEFKSGAVQAISALATTQLFTDTHQLGLAPRQMRCVLVDQNATRGYAAGDELDVGGINNSTYEAQYSATWSSPTQVGWIYPATAYGAAHVLNKGTGTLEAVAAAGDFKVRFYAWRGW